jgi:hypothetical protein
VEVYNYTIQKYKYNSSLTKSNTTKSHHFLPTERKLSPIFVDGTPLLAKDIIVYRGYVSVLTRLTNVVILMPQFSTPSI